MAMPAAGGEPPRAQKLRIMFKGTKLVEVTRPMQDPSTGVEADRSASGLTPLSQGAGNSGGEREQSQLPSDLIDFLSRELEDCLSPLGSWVDETFANGHHAAEDRAAADALQSAPATWQPSSVHVPPMGKGAEAAPWWEQAATPGGRSSDACSTHEGVFMDAPSPGSVSNGYLPQARCFDGSTQPEMPAGPSSQAPAPAFAAGKAASQEVSRPPSAPAQPQRRQQSSPEPRLAAAPQQQQHPPQQARRSPSTQLPASKPQQQRKPPRAKPVDWLAAEATPITASPRRDVSPAAATQPRQPASGAAPQQRLQKGTGAVSNASAAGSRGGSAPRSATSSPQPEPASARHQSPAAARGASHKAGTGVKRKGSPAATAASAAKRSSPGPDPTRRPAAPPGSQASLRGASPLANGSQAVAAAAAGKGTSKAAARPAGPAPARAGSGSMGRPAPPAAAAPILSRGAAAGEPVGGFGAGQWHGLREGQIVWAKMAGFPHWPAQVQAPTPSAQRVREPGMQRPVFVVFFGTADYQWLPASKLTRFGDSYRARAAPRDALLQQALDNAWWHLGEPKP